MAETEKQSPLRDMDDEARATLAQLLSGAKHAALAVVDPEDGLPNISRIAFARDEDGGPMTLISDLSAHAGALKAQPAAAILLGDPGDKGDPLTYPRVSLKVTASFVRHGTPDHPALARRYLDVQPKAKLYIGFADFSIVRFKVLSGLLNGGFGKAYPLTPADVLGAANA